MSTDEILYNRALEAIRELFNDHSISTTETKIHLQALIDEIEMMIDSIGSTPESSPLGAPEDIE